MSIPDTAKAMTLLDQGRAHLDSGNRAKAEACFRTAASLSELPAALNNWALCRHVDGDHAQALQILAPILEATDLAPFSRALASLAKTALGDRQSAKQDLQAAIRDLDAGLIDAQWRQAPVETAWVEYTALIKQAAGDLELDRMVLDLHGRWPGRDLPAGAFYAGVAAFNIGRYVQAAKYWRRIADPGWTKLMSAYAKVSDLAEAGVVPPFRLEYQAHDPKVDKTAKGSAEALAQSGSVRVRMLAFLVDPQAKEPAQMAQGLIGATGSWGVELGRRLLAGATVPMSLKMGAAQALTEAGVFAPNEPIPIAHQGKPTSIVVKKMEIQAEAPEAERVLEQARRLREAGKRSEALKLLADLTLRGIAYPPAMLMQANLMREEGELDGARTLLEALEKLAPDQPAVLFNLASLWIQYRNPERARAYVKLIDTAGTTKEFQRLLASLKEELRLADLLTNWPSADDMAESMRADAEEKPISPNVALAAALKQIPVQWLNAAAALHRSAHAKRRPERERALATALKDTVRLKKTLAAESAGVRDALQYLLDTGGWCKLQALTRRFGPLDGDGFFWDEQPPTSPIGRLRLLGLLFVGRSLVDGKKHKVAVIPADLRSLLTAML